VRRRIGFQVLFAVVIGIALLAVGVIYLTIECQSLPAFLGPTAGDTSPRSGLGVVFLVLGVAAFAIAYFETRRRVV
jgi:amino acid permease